MTRRSRRVKGEKDAPLDKPHTAFWRSCGTFGGVWRSTGGSREHFGNGQCARRQGRFESRIYACYNNERNCAMLGDIEITQMGVSAPYQLSNLPVGSYSVYALKNAAGEEYVGWYGFAEDRAKPPLLVTPPATEIDIQMIIVPDAERSSLPETVQELSAETRD